MNDLLQRFFVLDHEELQARLPMPAPSSLTTNEQKSVL
jgi:hypothetical protein